MNTAVVATNDEDTVEVIVKRNERALSHYERKRIRNGKTKEDHASGAWKRRIDNLALRAAWINENRGKTTPTPFPTHTCRGLGNSSKRFKMKAGKVVN